MPGPRGVTWTRQNFQTGVITSSPTAGTVVGLEPGGDGGGPPDGTATSPAAALLAALPVLPEDTSRYDRDLFPHWSDLDMDGCDTRDEVLITESQTPVTLGPGCALSGGRWLSYYDAATWTRPEDLQVDHVVALSEAWDSGAHAWTTSRREAFANDLAYAGTLQAVTGAVNQAKSDSDPAQWLPPAADAHCTYATTWVAIKWRWSLTIDPTEQQALTRMLAGPCGQRTIPVTPA